MWFVSESWEGGDSIISWPNWDLSFLSLGGGPGSLGLTPGPGEGLPGPWECRTFCQWVDHPGER